MCNMMNAPYTPDMQFVADVRIATVAVESIILHLQDRLDNPDENIPLTNIEHTIKSAANTLSDLLDIVRNSYDIKITMSDYEQHS